MSTHTQSKTTNVPAGSVRTSTSLVLLAAAALVASTAYLAWRVTRTMDANLWLAVPLLAAETVVLVRFALSLAATGPEPGPGVRANTSGDAGPATTDDEAEDGEGSPGERVEVFVVAAGADADALNRTLALASIDRPTAVRVLDTVSRSEIEAEAWRHGASYEVLGDPAADRVRPQQSQSAGLIDSALRSCGTPFALWLDAGDVPVPGLLDLVHAFDDPDVAVVQSAADLVNRDSLLHLAPGYDERALENRVAGPSLDRAGAAPWEGSGSLMRVAAFEQIGGMPSGRGSITHHGVLRLARAGMKVRFCAEPLVRTVAPDTLTDYLDIEERTSHGDWALLGTAHTPLRFGAGFRATLTQLHRSTTALDGLARFTFLGILTAVLLTGQLPFSAGPLAVAAAFAVQFILRSATVRALGRGTVRAGDPTRQSLRLMGARIAALFRPAPERGSSASRRWAVLGRLPLLTAALVVVDIALGLRILTLFWPDLLPPLDGAGRFVAMVTAAWAVLAILDVLHVLVARVQRRIQHRQGSDLVVELDGQPCRSVDLTPVGVGLLLPESLITGSSSGAGFARGDSVVVRLDVPRLDGSITTLEARARLEHVASEPDSGLYRAGAGFTEVPPHGRDALVEFCALTAEHRERSKRPVEETAPDDFDVAPAGGGRRALAMLSTIGLIVAGPFVALGPSAGAAPADPRTAVISGQVRDQAGDPVAGACVGVWNDGNVPWVNTDSDGRYELSSVAGGSHTVVAQDCSGGGYMATFASSSPWATRADQIEVAAAGLAEGVDVTVVPGVDVTGRVLDEKGQAASDVCVNYGPIDGEPGADQMWLGYTNDEGRYWGRVPAGQAVRIQLNDCGMEPRFATTWYPGTTNSDAADSVKVPEGDEFDLGDAVMKSGAMITGRVTHGKGEPMSSACVSAQDVSENSWNWIGGTNTDADGNYRFMVPEGTYSLWFSDCDGEQDFLDSWYPDAVGWSESPPTVDVFSGENRFDMTMRAGAVVTGTVFDDTGAPRPNVCVDAVSVHDYGWDWVAGTNTDSAGRYRFVAPEGQYSLTASGCDRSSDLVREFHDGSPAWSEPAPTIDLVEGAKEVRDFHMTRGGLLEGTVVDADGSPATGVCISAVDAESLRQDDWHSAGWARADDSGAWRTEALPAGNYVVHYSNCDGSGDWTEGGTWVPEFHDDVLEPSLRSLDEIASVEVNVASVTTLSADLLRAARVKGRITNGVVPAGGVCVNTSIGRQVTSDDDGYYSIGLVPGESTVTFSDCEAGRGLVQEVKTFNLGEGEGSILDLPMRQADPAAVTGSVRTASDGLLNPACVVAYVPDELIGMAMVDPSGNFEIPGLGAGSYWIGVFGCSEDPGQMMVDPVTGVGYPPSWFPGVPIGFFAASGPDPALDGASPVKLEPGATVDASFCFGGCVKTSPVSTTSTTTTTTTTTTTVPGGSVSTPAPPKSTAPSTTSAPATTSVPATTAAPTTAVPGGAPTAPAVPSPVKWSPAPYGNGGAAPVPTVDADSIERSTPAVVGPAVAATVMTAEEIAYAPEAVVSAEGSTRASDTSEPSTARQASFDSNDEVAAVTPLDTDGGTATWLWWAAFGLLLAVAAGLVVLRRRLS